MTADRQTFLHMIRTGIDLKRSARQFLAEMDAKIFEALRSYEVGFHLLPLPKGSVPTEKVDKPQQHD